MGTYRWKPFTLLVRAEEVEKEVLKIEAGKYYKTRDGRKVGPIISDGMHWRVKDRIDRDEVFDWYENGKFSRIRDSDNDIISEWQDQPSPIREVTRRELVAGVYGKIFINNYDETANKVWINVKEDFGSVQFDSSELREAAHTLDQVAEFLESEGK